MGVVYKARQVRLNRIVAVKMIRRGEAASVEETLHFRTEAEAAAKLRHPSIVKVHVVGELEGQPFFAMELIEGPTLAQLVLSGPLTTRRAAVYLQQIARAVEHAHRHGILHRDLKPANVLVDAADHVHVTDFGLAKSVHDDSELTQTRPRYGTTRYVPPEQIYGRRQQVGPTSDVYGLGAILYELLTGRPSFCAETTWEILAEVCQRDPLLPRLLNPQIPRELELICSQAHAERVSGGNECLITSLGHYASGRIRRRPPWILPRRGLTSQPSGEAASAALGYHVRAPSGREEYEPAAVGAWKENSITIHSKPSRRSNHDFAPKGP